MRQRKERIRGLDVDRLRLIVTGGCRGVGSSRALSPTGLSGGRSVGKLTRPGRIRCWIILTATLAIAGAATFAPGAQGRERATVTGVHTITANGRIGSLQLGSSTVATITGALGPAEGEAEGNFGGPGANYLGLGYECEPELRGELRSIGSEGPPYCHTIYYIDMATEVLGGFWTISRHYVTSHGTSVGTSEQLASRREHHSAVIGCLSGISELNRSVFLYLEIRGGATRPPAHQDEASRLVGGRVASIAIESRRDEVGVLFC